MFERYNEAARRSLFFARYEVSQRGGITIEPEHLLLGLLRKPHGLIGRIFAERTVSPSELQMAIDEQVTRGERTTPTSIEIPFSPETQRALGYAAEEADRLLHSSIGTEHLLLGVLREERSPAVLTLNAHGITLLDTRDAIVRLLREPAAPTAGESAAPDQRAEQVIRLELGVAPAERAELVRRLAIDVDRMASDLEGARERLRRIAAALEALGRDLPRG
jgi:ATP-dependent Clp protease ATP-binding subunit ClpC